MFGENDEETRIGRKCFKAFWLMRKNVNSLFDDMGIQGTQGRILGMIYVKKTMSPVEIAEIMRLTRPTITEHLNYLEKKGFITKTPSKTDRRSIEVRLTKKGNQAQESIVKRFTDFEQSLDNCFAPEEKKQLMDYLQRIIDVYSKDKPSLDHEDLDSMEK
jgi:DNA-binding MarR family transcriptional regulator